MVTSHSERAPTPALHPIQSLKLREGTLGDESGDGDGVTELIVVDTIIIGKGPFLIGGPAFEVPKRFERHFR
jgi:hypothetical protein